MPKYPDISFKDKDVELLKSKFGTDIATVKTVSGQDESQDRMKVKKVFKQRVSTTDDSGDKTESLSIQKTKETPTKEKIKLKDYFYSEDGDEKKLQVHKQSTSGKDKYRVIEGGKAEKKFNRVLKRSI